MLVTLRQWGQEHALAPGETHSVLVHDDGDPVLPVALVDHAGRAPSPRGTRVVDSAG